MKKFINLVIILIFSLFTHAQNVGIGTSTPQAKLEVKNPVKATVRVSSNGFNDTTQLILSNRNIINMGTDMNLTFIEEQGLNFSSTSDLPANANGSILMLKPSGRIGIGTTSPTAKLEVRNPVNAAVKISSSSFFDTSRLILSNRNGLNQGTDVNLTFIEEKGLNFSSTSDVPNNINESILMLKPSGRIGVNTLSPTEMLDVNGNVNIAGQIKVNGTAGTSGQVLQTLSSGATAWVNSGSFTYVKSWTGNGFFTIPAGVTRVMVEAWGGGGGGSSGGGGSAGFYTLSIQDITPGNTLTITIGVGGANATASPGAASNGALTSVTGLPTGVFAYGGRGATSTAPGSAINGVSNGYPQTQYTGQAGDANTFSYAQKNSTTFAIIRKYGDGGAAGPNYSRRSQGETIGWNENTNATLDNNSGSTADAPRPGGGGGGGFLGVDGADGMVVIWY